MEPRSDVRLVLGLPRAGPTPFATLFHNLYLHRRWWGRHSTYPVCRPGRPSTISISRRALCVADHGETTGTGMSWHRTSCFVRASTSRPPRRLHTKWLWPRRQLPPGSGTQLPACSTTRESPPQVGGAWQHSAVYRTVPVVPVVTNIHLQSDGSGVLQSGDLHDLYEHTQRAHGRRGPSAQDARPATRRDLPGSCGEVPGCQRRGQMPMPQ